MKFIIHPVHNAILGKVFDRPVHVSHVFKDLCLQAILLFRTALAVVDNAIQDVNSFPAGYLLVRLEIVVGTLHIAGSRQRIDSFFRPRRNGRFVGIRRCRILHDNALIVHIIVGNNGKFLTRNILRRAERIILIAAHNLFIYE